MKLARRDWLKKIRMAHRKTQTEVAESCCMTRQYYSAIEAGQRGGKLPVPTAQAIARALDFDWHLFYEDEQAG